MADSRAVNKELRAVIRPFLQTHGFRSASARTFWRHAPDRVEVVNFQSFNSYLAEGLRCTTHSFALNIGTFLNAIPPDARAPKERNGLPCPAEYECHFRNKLRRGLQQPELARDDIWYIGPDGEYLAEAVQDARRVIADAGLSWFDRLADPQAVLATLRSDLKWIAPDGMLPGNPDSPARNRAIAYLAWSVGDLALALEHLERLLEQARARDEANAKLRLRRPMPIGATPTLIADVERLRELVRQADSPN
jgi:hypothetical protein